MKIKLYYIAMGMLLTLKLILAPLSVPNYVPVLIGNGACLLLLVMTAASPLRKLTRTTVRYALIVAPLIVSYLEVLSFLPYLYYRNVLLNIFFMTCIIQTYTVFIMGSQLLARHAGIVALCAIAVGYQFLLFGRISDMTLLSQGVLYIVTTLVAVIMILNRNITKKNARVEGLLAEKTRLHEELLRVSARLFEEKRLSGLALMTAGLAHEINNPVNYLSGNLPFLRRYTGRLIRMAEKNETSDDDDGSSNLTLQEIVRDIESIYENYDQGLSRIRDIISGMKQIFLGGPVNDRPVGLRQIADSSLSFLGLKGHGKYEILNRIPETIELRGRPGDLYSLFTNLISNAVDAMPEGGRIEIETTLTNLDTTGDGLVLSVRDDGSGIDPQRIPTLTDPFYTTKTSEGTDGNMGLGLALCKTIMESYGGTIRIESEKNRYTKVELHFPKESVCDGKQ